MVYTQTQRPDEIEIDIGKILKALLRDWLVIVVSCAVGTAAAFLLALLMTPKYQSAAMFYVKNTTHASNASISSADIAASKELVDSYLVILRSEETLEAVIWYAGVDRSCEEVSKMISAAAVNSTEFFKVTVTSDDPQEAERIANAIVYILPERIARIMEGTSTRIVDTAVADSKPGSPDYPLITGIGFLLGFSLSAGGILLQSVLDKTIQNKHDLARCCTCPVLAEIATEEPYTAESYRLLQTKLRFALAKEAQSSVIGICSAMKGEGKSSVALNLAQSLARRGKKVLLIRCCPADSGMDSMLPENQKPGLAEYLSGACTMKDTICSCKTEDGKTVFSMIRSGEIPEDTDGILCNDRMIPLLKAARKLWDYVLLDLPALSENSGALEEGKDTDGILLVVRRDFCNSQILRNVLEQLGFVEANILGVVLYGGKEGSR